LKDFGFTKDQNGDRNSKKKPFVISNYLRKSFETFEVENLSVFSLLQQR
jgi:hypothetical protein